MVFLSPTKEMQGSTLNEATTASLYIFTVHYILIVLPLDAI